MPEKPNHYTAQVYQEDASQRLDKFLSSALPQLTRSRIQALIEQGAVAIEGSRTVFGKGTPEAAPLTPITNQSHKVKTGEIYVISVPPAVDTTMKPADIPLNVVYEDDHLLVIDKQAGLTVHPGAGNHNDTMANALLTHCGDTLSGIGGVQRPGIVHRLDKDTSGLLVVAKHDAAHVSLSEQLAERDLKRRYIAVTWGRIEPMAGKIEANIGRNPKDRKKMAVLARSGKKAITHYKVLETLAGGSATLVECRLETGRTHQIRVHFAARNHSLVGDTTYGQRPGDKLWSKLPEYVKKFPRQALHSTYIGFTHPETGEWMEFESPVGGKTSADLKELIESLRTLT